MVNAGAGVAVGAASMSLTQNNQKKYLKAANDLMNRPSEASFSGVLPTAESGIWETSDRRKLRAKKLLSLASEGSLSNTNLRSLYRLLDENGNQEVSASEMQSGLLLLGFESAADPVALSRFILDVDSDRTGTITEDEFLAYFLKADSDKMRHDIDGYVVTRTLITVTHYGLDSDGKPYLNTEHVQGSDLLKWMVALPENRGRMWLDVVGFDPDTFLLFAQALGVDEHSLMDSVLMQDAKLAVHRGRFGPKAEIILHTRELSVSPLMDIAPSIKSRFSGVLRDIVGWILGEDDEAEILENKEIIPRSQLLDASPAISLEQSVIIVADDKTLITFRMPAFEGSEEDLSHFRTLPPPPTKSTHTFVTSSSRVAPEPSSPKVSASLSETSDPLDNDPSLLRKTYQQLRTDMISLRPTMSHLFSSSAKSLAIAIADCILQQNHLLRDALQDWHIVLDRSIKRAPNTHHSAHLGVMKTIAELYTDRIRQLCEILNPGTWAASEEEDTSTDEDATNEVENDSTTRTTRTKSVSSITESLVKASPVHLHTLLSDTAMSLTLRNLTADKRTLTTPMSRKIAEMEEVRRPGGLLRLKNPDPEKRTSARQYFSSLNDDFMELSKDLRSVLITLDKRMGEIDVLKSTLQSLKSDVMNRTLFALTLITAVAVPLTFLTGLYGMNFDDMYELYPVGHEKREGVEFPFPIELSGYKFFWTLFGTILTILLAAMWRLGLLKALQ